LDQRVKLCVATGEVDNERLKLQDYSSQALEFSDDISIRGSMVYKDVEG